MKVSTDAMLHVLQVIIDECNDENDQMLYHAERSGGCYWMSLWGIHVASGYSMEYARQIVRELMRQHAGGIGCLMRMKKGVKFVYSPSHVAKSVIKKLEKSNG